MQDKSINTLNNELSDILSKYLNDHFRKRRLAGINTEWVALQLNEILSGAIASSRAALEFFLAPESEEVRLNIISEIIESRGTSKVYEYKVKIAFQMLTSALAFAAKAANQPPKFKWEAPWPLTTVQHEGGKRFLEIPNNFFSEPGVLRLEGERILTCLESFFCLAETKVSPHETDVPGIDVEQVSKSHSSMQNINIILNEGIYDELNKFIAIIDNKISNDEDNNNNNNNKISVIPHNNELNTGTHIQTNAPNSLLIPRKRVTVEKELGRGAFGAVFRGTWNHNEVAIKQLRLEKISRNILEDFQQEMEIMAALFHPNVVTMYGLCIDEPPYCIVMEYMKKGSLYSVLKNENLDWGRRELIAKDIGCGLIYLHTKNIVHGDLKSLNVLLDHNYNAKLGDFGLAKIKTAATTLGNQSIGTYAWTAPELLNAETQPPFSTNSDMYSYGMTLWELTSNKLPMLFSAGKFEVIKKHVVTKNLREDIPDETPAKLAYLIKWCWNKDPVRRPSAEQAVTYLETERVEESFKDLSVNKNAKKPSSHSKVRNAFFGLFKNTKTNDIESMPNFSFK